MPSFKRILVAAAAFAVAMGLLVPSSWWTPPGNPPWQPPTESELIEKIQSGRTQLSLIPSFARTAKLCRVAVIVRPSDFEDVPDGLIDQIMVDLYAGSRVCQLERIPMRFRNKLTCLTAVKSWARNLRHVPSYVLDREIVAMATEKCVADGDPSCLIIIAENTPPTLRYVISTKATTLLYMMDQSVLARMPEGVVNHDFSFWLRLVSRQDGGRFLCSVPFQIRDVRLSIAALRYSNDAWECVPKRLFFEFPEMRRLAYLNGEFGLENVPIRSAGAHNR